MHHKWLGICCALILLASLSFGQTTKMIAGDAGVYFNDSYWPIAVTGVQHNAGVTLIIADQVIIVNTNTFFTNGVLYGGAPVSKELRSVFISGPESIYQDSTNTFFLHGVYSDASQSNHTAEATWGEVSPVPSLTNTQGVVTAGDIDGSTNYYMTASFGGFSFTNRVNFSGPAEITNMIITGVASIAEGTNAQFSAYMQYDGDTLGDATEAATWAEVTPLANVSLTTGPGDGGLITVGDRDTTDNYTFTATFLGFAATNTVSVTGTAEADITLYPDYPATEPGGIDWTGFAAFSPPVASISSDSVIAEWTRIADSGESIMYASEQNITNMVVFSAAGTDSVTPTDYTLYGQAVMPSDGPKIIWANYGGNTSTPIRVGNADAWWLNPKKVVAGSVLRVFGINLGSTCKLWCAEESEWISSTSCNGYMAQFAIPGDWTNGTKTLYAHNGQGRKYGLSPKLTMTVISPVTWGGTTHNVVSGYSAAGDGVSDDSGEINNAINAASDGDTIYFPAGTYRVDSTIDLQNKRLRIQGAGRVSTEVFAPGSFVSYVVLDSIGDGSWFENITLAAGDSIDTNNDKMIDAQDADDLVFNNVRFSELRRTIKENLSFNVAHHFYNGHRLMFTNCLFNIAGRLNLAEARDVLVIDSDFAGLWDNNALVRTTGGANMSFIGNTIQNYNDTDSLSGYGWIKGRFLNWNSHGGNNVYIGDNRSVDVGPRYNPSLGWYDTGQVDQNSGEFAMAEGLHMYHNGSPSSFTSKTITFASLDPLVRTDHTMSIVHGTGFGQSRTITNVIGNTIYLDSALEVLPDTQSEITIGGVIRHLIAYGNVLDGRARNIEDLISNRNIASAGFEPYGGASDWIVVSNYFHEYRTPIDFFSRWKGDYDDDEDPANTNYFGGPLYFNLVAENAIDTCRNGIVIQVDAKKSGMDYNARTNLVGNVVRGNTLTGHYESFLVSEDTGLGATMLKTMLENNGISGGATNTDSFVSSYWITSGNTTNGVAWP